MVAKKSTIFNEARGKANRIAQAADLLNQNNPRANAMLATFLARDVGGEKGVLSDQDIARLAGDPSYRALIDRYLTAKTEGALEKMDRNDIRQILELAYEEQKRAALRDAHAVGRSYKVLGFDSTPAIASYIDDAFVNLPSYNQSNKVRNGNKGTPLPKGKVKVERGGQLFMIDESDLQDVLKDDPTVKRVQ